MKEITYQFISPEKEKKRDRFQLFSSAFILFIVILDVIENPAPIMLYIGILGLVLGCIFLFFAIRYDSLRHGMRDKFERLLFVLVGIVFLFNGAVLRMQGSGTVWMIHLALGLLYIAVLPVMANYGRKLLFLKLDESGFHVKKFPRGYTLIPWEAISGVSVQSGCLAINRFKKKRLKKFWLDNEHQSFLIALKEIGKNQNVELTLPVAEKEN